MGRTGGFEPPFATPITVHRGVSGVGYVRLGVSLRHLTLSGASISWRWLRGRAGERSGPNRCRGARGLESGPGIGAAARVFVAGDGFPARERFHERGEG